MIQFHNTLTGKLETFQPIEGGKVRMYTCGPTVYDYAHIGNFRAFVFEDLLRRFLEFSGFKVTHVMNLTDVDDKTIAGANKEGLPLDDFTAKYIEAFHQDLKALNVLPPSLEPRATREINVPKGMLELIGKLIEKKIAYESDGSIYFRVSAFPAYGKLSKKKLEGNIAGARVDVDEYDKEALSDFVLWKKAKEGEPSWDSPWGKGRPGWHIECSSMSMKYLGETFDIHAGGEDLIFPHHENEIAQSEAATGKPFVHYWLHCKFLLVGGEKMSKSKGNFYTLRDLLAKGYDPAAIRYALLSTHYRSPLNFTLDGLKEAADVIKRMDDCYADFFSRPMNVEFDVSAASDCIRNSLLALHENIIEALSDDLNISSAFASVFEGIKVINTAISSGDFLHKPNEEAAILFFNNLDRLFGFGIRYTESVPEEISRLMRTRSEVRRQIKEKNDKSLLGDSDRLREQIKQMGWDVKDGKLGEPSRLKKKRRVWD